MNPRIVWHLLKSDWRGLRFLILGFWLSLLLAAWFPLSYSPAHFDSPPLGSLGIGRFSERYGFDRPSEFDSAFRLWSQTTALWLLVGTSLSLAGTLGFHGRGWTFARPARKREVIASRFLAILLFLILPLLAVLLAIPLVQGMGAETAWTAASSGAGAIVPKLCSVCLFGALCGTWWRFAGGVLAFQVASMLAPFLGLWIVSPSWFSHPLGNTGWEGRSNLIAAAAIAIVLLATSRHTKPLARISIAIAALTFASWLMMSVPRLNPWSSPESSLYQPMPLPDWSGKVRPTLPETEWRAKMSDRRQLMSSFKIDRTLPGEGPYLELETPWGSKGLSQGTFAEWARSGKAELVSQGKVITESVPSRAPDEALESDWKKFNLDIIAAALGTDGKPATISRSLAASANSYITTNFESDIFAPVTRADFPDTSLVSDLTGIAYKLEKIVDVPLGSPVEVKVDGLPLYIRRIERSDGTPLVNLCYKTDTKRFPEYQGRRSSDAFLREPAWIPVMYLPALGEYATLSSNQSRGTLAPGCFGISRTYTMSWRPEFLQHPEDFAGMRFILLRRVNLGRMKEQFRSSPQPLVVGGVEEAPSPAPHPGEGPSSAKRPDPATASDAELIAWLRNSEAVYDFSDYTDRDFAAFVPRQLPTLLSYRSAWTPPPSSLGGAIAIACPESRRGEVIDALLRQAGPSQETWIPKVILARGWVEAAAPQIREWAARGTVDRNYEAQTVIAMLEDPQTYPALLNVEKWTGWPGIYFQTRRLPGIEPALTKAIEENYRRADKRGFRRPGAVRGGNVPNGFQEDLNDKFYICLIPAAHGMPDAFAELLKTWQAYNESEQRRHHEMIREAVLLPGNSDDWKSAVGALAAREPSDFRYDTLARLWVPVAEPKQ